jgi:Uma2 family endonuclease
MAEHLPSESWTGADFLAWEEAQEIKHEWVGGRVYAMAGAKNRHELIKGNLYRLLHRKLPSNGPCEPFGSDTKIAIPNGNYRYPDLVIDCTSPRDLDSQFADNPRVIFEILSPSNRWYDRERRIADYQLLETCHHIAVVWSTAARIEVLSRDDQGQWLRSAETYDGRDTAAVFTAIDVTLPLDEVYRGFQDTDLPD